MSVEVLLSINEAKEYHCGEEISLLLEVHVKNEFQLKNLGFRFEGISTVVASAKNELLRRRGTKGSSDKIMSTRDVQKVLFSQYVVVYSRNKVLRNRVLAVKKNFRLPKSKTPCQRQDILSSSTLPSFQRDQNYLLPPTFLYVGKDGELVSISYKFVPILNNEIEDSKRIEGKALSINFVTYPSTIHPSLMPALAKANDYAALEYENQSLVQSQWHLPFPIYTHSQTMTLGASFGQEGLLEISESAPQRGLVPGKLLDHFVTYTLIISLPKIHDELQHITRITKAPETILAIVKDLTVTLVRVIRYKAVTRTVYEGSIELMQVQNREASNTITAAVLVHITDGRNLVLKRDRLIHKDGTRGGYLAYIPPSWLAAIIPDLPPAFSTSDISVEYYLATELTCTTLSGPLHPIHLEVRSPVLVSRLQNMYRL